jgi:hypothetical protein
MRTLFIAGASVCAVLAGSFCAQAAPMANQLVPIAVYQGYASPFGLAYDPGNNVMWIKDTGGGPLRAITPFNAFTPAQIASFGPAGPNGVVVPFAASNTGLTTPNVFGQGAQALGFYNGQIVMHRGGGNPIGSFDPVTGGNVNGNLFSPMPAGTSFLDGLDVDAAGNFYFSPEPASTGGDSYRNSAIFLNNANAAQTDVSPPAPGVAMIVRWAGIEEITSLGLVFTVADTGGNSPFRTIATFDLLGNLIAVDPDGSPFASRLEDLAFDGRYLYGTDFATNQIFVFDIVGPGGLQPVPEPASMLAWGLLTGVGLAGYRLRRRKVA